MLVSDWGYINVQPFPEAIYNLHLEKNQPIRRRRPKEQHMVGMGFPRRSKKGVFRKENEAWETANVTQVTRDLMQRKLLELNFASDQKECNFYREAGT
jgi:hypothetical protein